MVGGRRAYAQAAVVRGDPAETVHPLQIHQVRVVREPKLHGKQQLGAAAVRGGVIAQFAQEAGRLLDRPRTVDGERRQLHALGRSGMRPVLSVPGVAAVGDDHGAGDPAGLL